MLNAIDLFFILLTAVVLLIVISLAVALYSAASSPGAQAESKLSQEESLTPSLPHAHMTRWHIGDHLADALPPRAVSSRIEQLPFNLPYHSTGDTALDESQEKPTHLEPVNKTLDNTNQAMREMIHLHHKDHPVE